MADTEKSEQKEIDENFPPFEVEEESLQGKEALNDAELDLYQVEQQIASDSSTIDGAIKLIDESVKDANVVATLSTKAALDADIELFEAKAATQAYNGKDKAIKKELRQKEKLARKAAKKAHKNATKKSKDFYKTVKFSQPGHHGALAVVMGLYIFSIFFTLCSLILTSRDNITYNAPVMYLFVGLIFQAIALWLYFNRFKVMRIYMIVILSVDIIVNFLFSIFGIGGVEFIDGGITTASVSYGFDISFSAILLVYFIFSKRVKLTLTRKFSLRNKDNENKTEKTSFYDVKIQPWKWPWVRNLIIYYCVFSVVGHWMEAAMCQLIRLGIVEGAYDPTNTMLWRDWFYPFPMEGLAVVIIALLIYPFFMWLRKKCKYKISPFIITFVAGALLCSIIEFSMGLVVNDHLQLWDYSTHFCNIMGQVCLQNTLAFGAVAALVTWFLYPWMERQIQKVPPNIMNIVFIFIVAGYSILQTLYLINV